MRTRASCATTGVGLWRLLERGLLNKIGAGGKASDPSARSCYHDSVGTSLGGGSDLMYATSRQIIAGCSAPPKDGIPFGRPSAIERKMSASAPPYLHRPSVR